MSAVPAPTSTPHSGSPATVVSVRGLSKRYGEIAAVREVGFDVAAGEIFGLLGPNGAGKTTTLECLLGLRQPDAGEVYIGGVDAQKHPAEARRLTGAHLQTAALQDKITPREALRLFGSFYPAAIDSETLLARFELVEKAAAHFDTLSGGQQQRLLLALAFVHRPRLVVLDEPTVGLDPQSRRELHTLIRSLRAEGCTILLSTHHLDEAQQLCDRIGILHHGRIIADAAPDDLIAGARSLPRIRVLAGRPLDRGELAPLDGVESVEPHGAGWSLATREVTRTISALARRLDATGNPLLDLQIQRPTLEDVFLELTGDPWTETAAPAGRAGAPEETP